MWAPRIGSIYQNGSCSSVVLLAVESHPSMYLTFEESDNHPVIQENATDATKFDVKFPPPQAK